MNYANINSGLRPPYMCSFVGCLFGPYGRLSALWVSYKSTLHSDRLVCSLAAPSRALRLIYAYNVNLYTEGASNSDKLWQELNLDVYDIY